MVCYLDAESDTPNVKLEGRGSFVPIWLANRGIQYAYFHQSPDTHVNIALCLLMGMVTCKMNSLASQKDWGPLLSNVSIGYF